MFADIEEAADRTRSIATDEGVDSIAARIDDDVRDYLDDQELTVAFLGEFSVGKSSLLNAMLDSEVLPIEVAPTTSLVTEIRRGSKRYVLRRDGGEQRIDRERFEALAKGDEPTDTSDVVEMYLEHGLIEERNCFVDTPGVDSLEDQHEDITYGYISESDAACIVLDGNQGEVPRSVVDFLEHQVLDGDVAKLVFAVNKLDQVPGPNRDKVVAKIRETLSEYVDDPRVVPTSANVDDMHPDDPGVDDLRSVLVDDVLADRQSILAERASSLLEGTIDDLIGSLQTRAEGLDSSTEELDEQIETLKEDRNDIQDRLRRMERDIRQEMESIRDRADRELRTMLRDVSSKAERHIRSAGPGDIESLNLQQKVSGWISRGVEDVIRDNIEPRLRELGDDVEQSIDDIRTDIGALDVEAPRGNDAVGTTLDVAVEGAMLVALNVVLPGEWVVAVIGRLLGSDLLEKLKGPVTRSIKQLFGRVSKSAIVDKTVDKVDTEIMALHDDLSQRLSRELSDVEDDLVDELEGRLNEKLDNHREALEKARRKREQKDEEVRQEQSRLEERIRTLREIRAEVT